MVRPMTRIAAGIAWTFSLMWVGNYVGMVTGVPVLIPALVAIAIGALVAADPLGRIWATAPKRQVPATASVSATSERVPQA
jgi:hypothetical protein